jgi:hypothetical protein
MGSQYQRQLIRRLARDGVIPVDPFRKLPILQPQLPHATHLHATHLHATYPLATYLTRLICARPPHPNYLHAT